MKYLFFITYFISFFSCKENSEYLKNKTRIPVAEVVGTGAVINLSDHAEAIEYIPLETHDSVLVSNITQIAYEKEKIIVLTDNDECMIFNRKGEFQYRIGHKGLGPYEFISISSFDILSDKQQLFLQTHPYKYFLYSLDGQLLKKIHFLNIENDCSIIKTMNIYSNYYFSDVASYSNVNYKGFIFQDQDSTSALIKKYTNNTDIEIENKNGFSYIHEVAHFYRYKNELCYHKNINDTVYSLDSIFEMKKKFIFDFGKYKATASWLLEKNKNKVLQYIWPLEIQESERFLFIKFFFGNHATEKFEYTRTYPTGIKRVLTNYEVCGLFDKQSGALQLLNQPHPKQFGFGNDIDNGPCFWPKYITSDNKMLTWWNASDFLALYEQLDNPSPNLTKVAGKLSPDDNPVLMVVTLK